MSKSRLEAFSDGVIAIIITIMVLQLVAPAVADLSALLPLVPFATAWVGENSFAAWPVAFYGVVLFLAAVAYFILTRTLVSLHGRGSVLAAALGADVKGKASIVIYAAAIGLSFVEPLASCILYVAVAVIWLVPDRRIEKRLER
jgi:uncharacterized membrane protein